MTVEQSTLAELTRSVALALRDDDLRHQVLGDMKRAPFREHKLDLQSYLAGSSNAALLARMAHETDRTVGSVSAAIDSVRRLEFYMPVRSQRESWTGGTNLLVGSQLEDGGDIQAFNLDGTAVPVSISKPPATPILMLVPVETDFSRPVDGAQFRNTHDNGGASIGTLVALDSSLAPSASLLGGAQTPLSLCSCDQCPDADYCQFPPPPPPGPGPNGIYFTALNLRDLGESWPRGDPEIEVHVFGTEVGYNTPLQVFNGQTYVWVDQFHSGSRLVWMDCAGENAAGYHQFNFDNLGHIVAHDWYLRDVLIAETNNFATVERVNVPDGGPTISQRRVPLQAPFEIRILERDGGSSCPEPPHVNSYTIGVSVITTPYGYHMQHPNWGSVVKAIEDLLGAENDPIAGWNTTIAALEAESGTITTGGNADIYLKNEGFSHVSIPSGLDPQP